MLPVKQLKKKYEMSQKNSCIQIGNIHLAKRSSLKVILPLKAGQAIHAFGGTNCDK